MAKVAFLGLGVMGYPMAGHLAKAGHEVRVYNRTASKAEAWASEHGGTHAATPREAAEGAEFVMACVGNDDDLREVCTGQAITRSAAAANRAVPGASCPNISPHGRGNVVAPARCGRRRRPCWPENAWSSGS